LSGDIVVAWLIDHGTRILIILVVGAILWFALNRFLPPIVRRTVGRTKYKESKEGLEKRTNTLVSIFRGVGRVFIVIIAIFWFILPQTGLADSLGNAYIFVALIGSLVISYFVSWGLNKMFSMRRRK